MSKLTWIGGLVLLLSLVIVRFVDVWAGTAVAVVGAGVFVAGLALARRAQRAAVAAPSVSWAEELTARVRAERAAAAQRAAADGAAQAAQAAAPAGGPAQGAPAAGASPLPGAVG